MKKMINNRVLILLFVTLFGALSVNANPGDPKPAVPVELKLAGFIRNQPLFQLNINGDAQQDDFIISINDEFGTNLYRENIKGETFSKKFLLNTDEIGDNTLLFEITSRKTNTSVVYAVNRNSRYVQDIAINEVK